MSIQSGTAFQFLFDQGFSGIHDVINDTLFLALYSTLADISPETVNLQAAIGNELVGVGYTAGGVALTQTLIYTPGGPDRPAIDLDDVLFGPGANWGVTNEAAAGAVIYNNTAGPQLNKVLWVISFGGGRAVNNGTFRVIWPDPTNPALAAVRTTG